MSVCLYGCKCNIFYLTININEIRKQGKKTIEDNILDEIFETYWPLISKKLELIKNADRDKSVPKRDEREILEEILQIVRGNSFPLIPH